MDRDMLLDLWHQRKASGAVLLRLRGPYDQQYVFRGPQWGHPSNFAMVHFRCSPSERLSFDPSVSWPGSISANERPGLVTAMACGIVDGLLGATLQPRCLCALSLLAVGWDDVMSSEEAFYQATKGAMAELIAHGPWVLRAS